MEKNRVKCQEFGLTAGAYGVVFDMSDDATASGYA